MCVKHDVDFTSERQLRDVIMGSLVNHNVAFTIDRHGVIK